MQSVQPPLYPCLQCDQQFHTKVEDRPVIKETVTQIREHHPIEKEFVVETRPTGREKELTERAQTEVGVLAPYAASPDRHD